MRFLDLLQLILENLNRRKGRVLLTAVGVTIGTAAVVILVSLGVGLQKNFTSQLGGNRFTDPDQRLSQLWRGWSWNGLCRGGRWRWWWR